MPTSLSEIDCLVMDFDGVMTDNAVWVMEDGRELVRCDRSDGLGIARLGDSGMPMFVLSTEVNPVVSARCTKLGLPVIQGIADKGRALSALLSEQGIDPLHVAFLGNDLNDADCLTMVGLSIVVADAHPSVLPLADIVLERAGGHGAVRELCDLLLAERQRSARASGDSSQLRAEARA